MVEQKYARTLLPYNVTLHRWYVGATPDELGTPDFWAEHLHQIYAWLPFPSFLDGLDLNVWHMDSPQMEEQTRNKLSNLQDYDPAKAGYQVACGLYFNRDRLDLAVFPDGWKPEDPPMIRPITEAARRYTRKALSHEIGHHHHACCGLTKTTTAIQKALTQHFLMLRPTHIPSEFECWAEVFRAYGGALECRGALSDGLAYTQADNPKLYSLIRCAYWLQGNLANVDFDGFQVWNDRVCWEEYRLVWTWSGWQRQKAGFHCVDHAFVKWRWDGVSRWVRV